MLKRSSFDEHSYYLHLLAVRNSTVVDTPIPISVLEPISSSLVQIIRSARSHGNFVLIYEGPGGDLNRVLFNNNNNNNVADRRPGCEEEHSALC